MLDLPEFKANDLAWGYVVRLGSVGEDELALFHCSLQLERGGWLSLPGLTLRRLRDRRVLDRDVPALHQLRVLDARLRRLRESIAAPGPNLIDRHDPSDHSDHHRLESRVVSRRECPLRQSVASARARSGRVDLR
jgi:LmbE family N-acetylglucosaminyl deacetylase